jgi:sRNA-binding protein
MSLEGIGKLAKLFPHCFALRRPLKIGIREDIFARAPDIPRDLIVTSLRAYTRCVPYWLLLKAGTPRIDLDGNVAGAVTIEDEAHAERKITQAARRAAAKATEDRNAVGQPPAKPVAARTGQQDSIPQVKAQQPAPACVGLAGLKAAAQARRARLVAAK